MSRRGFRTSRLHFWAQTSQTTIVKRRRVTIRGEAFEPGAVRRTPLASANAAAARGPGTASHAARKRTQSIASAAGRVGMAWIGIGGRPFGATPGRGGHGGQQRIGGRGRRASTCSFRSSTSRSKKSMEQRIMTDTSCQRSPTLLGEGGDDQTKLYWSLLSVAHYRNRSKL